MFGWADLIIAFVMGAIITLWCVSYLARRWLDRLRAALEKAVAEEASQTTTKMTREEALANDNVVPLNVEVENNLYYCYNSKTNQFICQGADVKEITEKFKARFPGLNAFFESGDEQALATLKQQLKDNRESSSSI